MNRNLDEQLHTMFKEHRNCELPEDIQITIDATLDNIKNSSRKKYLFSKILAGCAIFLFAFTVVFAKDIKNLANNIFNYQFNGNQGNFLQPCFVSISCHFKITTNKENER